MPPLAARVDSLVSRIAERDASRTALISNEERVSYGELAARVETLARALIAAGIQPGDRVATLQTPCPEFVVSFLATASIGAIWVGLNPRYRLGELRQVIEDAQPQILFTRLRIGERTYVSELQDLFRSVHQSQQLVAYDTDVATPGDLGPPMRAYSAFLAAGYTTLDTELADRRRAVGGHDPCLLVYTSGSTGQPKGALLHHQGIIRFSRDQNRLWPVEPLRILNYFPINHIGCVVDVTMPCLEAGGTMVCLEHFSARASLELMQKEAVTFWGSVPSVFEMQLADPAFSEFDLSAVQLIVWEGAAMPEARIRDLIRICPRLATNYGMTETTSAITALAPTDSLERLTQSVGGAFAGVTIRLVDNAGDEVAQGAVGEVQVRSPNNCLGYWQKPEATRAAFTCDGFFRTGDLALQRSDGLYRICGRLKEMYKSGGYNVYPREIERVLESHEAVASAAVIGIADPEWQEVGIAFVTLRSPVEVKLIAAWCREHMANYKVPKHIAILDHLPLLPIGKVDKLQLQELARHYTPRLSGDHV